MSAVIDASRRRSSTELVSDPVREVASATDVAEAVTSRAALVTALAALPPRQRACVVLRYFEDLSVADTARALGCSEGNVKSQTARRLDRLRSVLDGSPELTTEGVAGVAGKDYDVLASYANKDLNTDNGQYFTGLTDDGLILFKDGPHGARNTIRWGLRAPATGATDWLPQVGADDTGQMDQMEPLDLGKDRLIFTSTTYAQGGSDLAARLSVESFDRTTRTWTTITWASLPTLDGPFAVRVGPDGRVYVPVPATKGSPPPGGWPTGPDGEADDAAAEGETYELWSASLTDPGDVRDEGLRVGDFAFTRDALVWSAATNGINVRIHVRDLATGKEHDFDPKSGKRCNLLGFSASGDRIVLSQYCGTYDDGRDDRVQILTTSGETVATIQGDGLGGGIADGADGDGRLVDLSLRGRTEGYYVYELETGRLVRVTDSVSSWGLGGPTPAGHLFWDTAYGAGKGPDGMDSGATQWLARWRDPGA